jgi:hypothetical protein
MRDEDRPAHPDHNDPTILFACVQHRFTVAAQTPRHE